MEDAKRVIRKASEALQAGSSDPIRAVEFLRAITDEWVERWRPTQQASSASFAEMPRANMATRTRRSLDEPPRRPGVAERGPKPALKDVMSIAPGWVHWTHAHGRKLHDLVIAKFGPRGMSEAARKANVARATLYAWCGKCGCTRPGIGHQLCGAERLATELGFDSLDALIRTIDADVAPTPKGPWAARR